MKKRKWPILFLSITLILVVAFVTNQIAIGNKYSELMDSYRNDKIEYRSDGTITGYSNVYFSPLGLYGSVRLGMLERKIDGTDEIKKYMGTIEKPFQEAFIHGTEIIYTTDILKI